MNKSPTCRHRQSGWREVEVGEGKGGGCGAVVGGEGGLRKVFNDFQEALTQVRPARTPPPPPF